MSLPPSSVLPSAAAKEQVFAGFVAHYGDVTSYAASRAKTGDEAGDIVQDAYLRVFRLPHPEKIREPRPFLFRLVRNLLIDRLRQREVRQRHAAGCTDIERIADAAPQPDASAIAGERRALLAATVAALPGRTREIFILHAYARMSYAEIAVHMGLSKSGVAKHLAKAMEAIDARLADR